jgi:hypothetical protein
MRLQSFKRALALGAVASLLNTGCFAQGNLVVNGGFEDLWNGWDWTVNVASVGFLKAAEGERELIVYDTIAQNIPTIPGQTYRLFFQLAGDNRHIQTVEIAPQWGGTSLTPVIWRPGGHSQENPGWVTGQFDVVATSTSTRLTFVNPIERTGDLPRLPFLDDVRLTEVPEPSTSWLLVVGAFALLNWRTCQK